MKTAVYPGTFDPITRGHIDIGRRGSGIFDELIVAVGSNPHKQPLFSLQERLEMVRKELGDLPNVSIDSFKGLLVDYVKSKGTGIILRGIRTVADFEYELQMALTNRKYGGDIETVFVMASEEYSYLNSQLIKEIAGMGGDVSAFVTPGVARALRERLGSSRQEGEA